MACSQIFRSWKPTAGVELGRAAHSFTTVDAIGAGGIGRADEGALAAVALDRAGDALGVAVHALCRQAGGRVLDALHDVIALDRAGAKRFSALAQRAVAIAAGHARRVGRARV